MAGGLVDILHAGVVVATHAQRFRSDQSVQIDIRPAQSEQLTAAQPGRERPPGARRLRDDRQARRSVSSAEEFVLLTYFP